MGINSRKSKLEAGWRTDYREERSIYRPAALSFLLSLLLALSSRKGLDSLHDFLLGLPQPPLSPTSPQPPHLQFPRFYSSFLFYFSNYHNTENSIGKRLKKKAGLNSGKAYI